MSQRAEDYGGSRAMIENQPGNINPTPAEHGESFYRAQLYISKKPQQQTKITNKVHTKKQQP
jgi:hypothetical protein